MAYRPVITQNNTSIVIARNLFLRFIRCRAADLAFSLFYSFACLIGKLFNVIGPQFYPISRKAGEAIGVQSIPYSYYTPLPSKQKNLSFAQYTPPLGYNSRLIQSEFYESLQSNSEFAPDIFCNYINHLNSDYNCPAYYSQNSTFCLDDAVALMRILLTFRPKNILEIGSGNSSLILHAYKKYVKRPDVVSITCIEPFEADWLSNLDVRVMRERIEDISLSSQLFNLKDIDFVFIDSSHVVRIAGDVSCIYTQLVPQLSSGTVVHVHDIFSPAPFRSDWINDRLLMWGERVIVDALVAVKALEHLFTTNDLYSESNLHRHADKYAHSLGQPASVSSPSSSYFRIP